MLLAEIAAQLKTRDRILILCHGSPDGDTIGSACALLHGLRRLGKQGAIQCSDPFPKKFQYLFENLPHAVLPVPREDGKAQAIPQEASPEISPKRGGFPADGSEGESKEARQGRLSCALPFVPEYVVAVDVADIRLLGDLAQQYRGRIDLVIDHHKSHRNFAAVDYVDASCGANAEIIYALLLHFGMDIDGEIANALYTGIATDTGCFRYRNVTWSTHAITAEIIARGADAGGINQRLFETKTRGQLAAEARILKSLSFHHGDRVGMVEITQALLKETGMREDEMDAFVSLPRQIQGVLVGVTLKERKDGGFKISFRTNPPANAAGIAEKLGGGGHNGAAACSCKGPQAAVREKVLRACESYLKEMTGTAEAERTETFTVGFKENQPKETVLGDPGGPKSPEQQEESGQKTEFVQGGIQ